MGLLVIKFMFSKKATKNDKIFTVDLTLCSKFQIDSEDFVNFCGLLRKYKHYDISIFGPFGQPGQYRKKILAEYKQCFRAFFMFSGAKKSKTSLENIVVFVLKSCIKCK